MTERVEYDCKIKGDIEDAGKYPSAVIDSTKEGVLFHRARSKKGGVDFRKASKGLLPFLGSIFGHDNMVVFLLSRYYETNGSKGICEDEAIEHLQKEGFCAEDIELLLHEAKNKTIKLRRMRYHDKLKEEILS